MYIDAHHHMWKFNSVEYDWIDESMQILKKDFLIKELEQTLNSNGFAGSIVVQARQLMAETTWLLELAHQSELIKGVVGWIDLKSTDLVRQLDTLSHHTKLVGFRHVIQAEPDPEFMLDPLFIRGLKILAESDYCYDLLIYAHQLPAAIKMLAQVPELSVVIDHIAKPDIKTGKDFKQWQQGMAALAENPNCYCKLSGMVTEADWSNWTAEDLKPFIDSAVQLFGPQRIMFGSDWPVCLVAADYQVVKQVVLDYFSQYLTDDIDGIFGLNALRFYNI